MRPAASRAGLESTQALPLQARKALAHTVIPENTNQDLGQAGRVIVPHAMQVAKLASSLPTEISQSFCRDIFYSAWSN